MKINRKNKTKEKGNLFLQTNYANNQPSKGSKPCESYKHRKKNILLIPRISLICVPIVLFAVPNSIKKSKKFKLAANKNFFPPPIPQLSIY